MEVTLLAALEAANALTPLIASLIGQLRKSGQTDEEVIADARAKVAETKIITEQDMGPTP